MAPPRPGRCPACGEEIEWSYSTAPEFYCPNCGIGLTVSRSYYRVVVGVALVMVGLLFWVRGVQGIADLVLAGLALLGTILLVFLITTELFPADLEATGDWLHMPTAADASHGSAEDEEPAGPEDASTDRPVAIRALMFQIEAPTDRDREGRHAAMLLLVVVAAMAVGHGILYWARPELYQSNRAPSSFVMLSDVREDAIVFTNMSEENWDCRVTIGFRFVSRFRSRFSLSAHQTRSIPYAEFLPAGDDTRPAVLRSTARRRLWAACTEPSGRRHAGYLE